MGYQSFHPEQLYRFQLNTWYALGYLPHDAMIAAGKRASDVDRVFTKAESA